MILVYQIIVKSSFLTVFNENFIFIFNFNFDSLVQKVQNLNFLTWLLIHFYFTSSIFIFYSFHRFWPIRYYEGRYLWQVFDEVQQFHHYSNHFIPSHLIPNYFSDFIIFPSQCLQSRKAHQWAQKSWTYWWFMSFSECHHLNLNCYWYFTIQSQNLCQNRILYLTILLSIHIFVILVYHIPALKACLKFVIFCGRLRNDFHTFCILFASDASFSYLLTIILKFVELIHFYWQLSS